MGVFGERLRLGKENTEAGNSVLPAAPRVSAPGCWAIRGAGGWDTDTMGWGNMCVCVRETETETDTDWTPHLHYSQGRAGAVGWGFQPARPGLGGPSSSFPALPNLDLRWPLSRGRWKRVFLPRPGPTPHGRARGSLPRRFKTSEGYTSFPDIRVRGCRRSADRYGCGIQAKRSFLRFKPSSAEASARIWSHGTPLFPLPGLGGGRELCFGPGFRSCQSVPVPAAGGQPVRSGRRKRCASRRRLSPQHLGKETETPSLLLCLASRL